LKTNKVEGVHPLMIRNFIDNIYMAFFKKGISVVKLASRFGKIQEIGDLILEFIRKGNEFKDLKDELKIIACYFNVKIIREITENRLNGSIDIRVNKYDSAPVKLGTITKNTGQLILEMGQEADIEDIILDLLQNGNSSIHWNPPSYKLNWVDAGHIAMKINDLKTPG
jgi:hypothetical protein